MSEVMLIFECDPQVGTPKLQAVNGASKAWTSKDMGLLEDELRRRYDGLVREGAGIIVFKGRTLYVKKKDGDNSRQPTLELQSSAFTVPLTERPFVTPRPVQTLWEEGFLAEIDRLFASDSFNVLLPVEKAMLKLVREELQGLLDKKAPTDAMLLVLVSILMTAEHLSRTQHPNEPRPYAYALSGIERLLSETSVRPRTPWGDLPAQPSAEPPPSWLSSFWARLTGA